jgi:hypothetical protein
MQLFNLNENGDLIKKESLQFSENDVYVVDDERTIFIWVGLNSSQNKRDLIADFARKIEEQRPEGTKILIMKQNREYGSFLAMMDKLRKGKIPGLSIERRTELELEGPSEPIISEEKTEINGDAKMNQENNIIMWLEQLKKYREPQKDRTSEGMDANDLKTQIRESAYFLSLENYSYNDLCWLLAEKILNFTLRMPTIEDTKKKAEEIFNSSCTYDELCWLNAEMEILAKKEYLVRNFYEFNF